MTLDIRKEMKPDVWANAETLPFRDASFDFVLADPPYSEEESRDLYGLPYVGMARLMREAWRVTRPGGYLLLLHRTVPVSGAELKMLRGMCAIVGVTVLGAWANMRALTVWRKPGSIDPVFWEQVP